MTRTTSRRDRMTRGGCDPLDLWCSGTTARGRLECHPPTRWRKSQKEGDRLMRVHRQKEGYRLLRVHHHQYQGGRLGIIVLVRVWIWPHKACRPGECNLHGGQGLFALPQGREGMFLFRRPQTHLGVFGAFPNRRKLRQLWLCHLRLSYLHPDCLGPVGVCNLTLILPLRQM